MNTVIDKLASSLNRRDEAPNSELAKLIAENGDSGSVKELVINLYHKDKNIQADCIKVLYETGTLEPGLIAPHIDEFIKLLGSSNNRMVWGSMYALNAIALEKPDKIFEALPKLIDIANKGTVITRDQTVGIMIKLCTLKEYKESVFPLLTDQMRTCPVNQLPMYAENTLPLADTNNRDNFIKTLTSRLGEIDKDTKRIRVEKVIGKLSKN